MDNGQGGVFHASEFNKIHFNNTNLTNNYIKNQGNGGCICVETQL